MGSYIVRKALSDEANQGWIWIGEPSRPKPLISRTVMKIKEPRTGKSVFAEIRVIDDNFVKQYNECHHRVAICGGRDTLVMSEWYRNALGVRVKNLLRICGAICLFCNVANAQDDPVDQMIQQDQERSQLQEQQYQLDQLQDQQNQLQEQQFQLEQEERASRMQEDADQAQQAAEESDRQFQMEMDQSRARDEDDQIAIDRAKSPAQRLLDCAPTGACAGAFGPQY